MQKRQRNSVTLTCLVAVLGSAFAADSEKPFEPGALSGQRVTAAARLAGFRVRDVKTDIPEAIRPTLPFFPAEYDDETLARLRRKYSLERVAAAGRDEWSSQLLLKEWVHKAIPGGTPAVSYNNALEILEHAAHGEPFWCTHYTISYAECAAALGWQVRKIGVDRPHGPEGMGSSHHGVAEVWSNQFRKWVVIDAQSNLHFERAGIPLSAWEIRAEWLRDAGKSVDHMVGVPPQLVKKNPAMSWRHFTEDETSTYFWIYVENRVLAPEKDSDEKVQLILPQDKANAGLIWYQNGEPEAKGSQLHVGYLQNRFVPTQRIEDVYWTVGVIEAIITGVSDSAIRFSLDSYCPGRSGYEVSIDGVRWNLVKDERNVAWPLKANWNSLRLRTVGKGGVTGPVTSLLMFLEAGRSREKQGGNAEAACAKDC
jgi:hypothetical protein